MDLKKIIKLCLKNDERAFNKLYHKYSPIFGGICRRYTYSLEEIDDILQEAFISIFNNLHQLKEAKLFEPWAKRIVINTAIKTISSHNTFFLNIEDYKLDITENEELNSKNIIDKMDITELIKLMDLLPTGYKTILNLYAVEEFSHKEIGEILNIKEATSRSQYFKAKRAFQNILLKKITEENHE